MTMTARHICIQILGFVVFDICVWHESPIDEKSLVIGAIARLVVIDVFASFVVTQ